MCLVCSYTIVETPDGQWGSISNGTYSGLIGQLQRKVSSLSHYLAIRQSVQPCIHPSVQSSVHSSIHPPVRPSVRPSAHPSVDQFVHSSVHSFVHPSARPSVRPSAHPSMYICPVIGSSVHSPIHTHTYMPFNPPIDQSISMFNTCISINPFIPCFDAQLTLKHPHVVC